MKQRKNKRDLLIVCMLLLALCFITGCGLFKSDTEQLKDLLEDKYGEKFGIESYYYDGDMWAMCYPVNDPTLLFQVRTDEYAERIKHDYYLQNVVARQVEEEYGPLVEQAFPGSYLSVDISAADYEGQTADKVSLESMLQYHNSSSDDEDEIWTHITLYIFADKTQMLENNIENEYALLKDVIGIRVANGELPDVIVKMYIGDTSFVRDCKDIIKKTTWADSDISEKVKDYPIIWVGYDSDGTPYNGPDLTLERYIEKRTEVLNNG